MPDILRLIINATQRIQRTRDYLRHREARGLSAYARQEPSAVLHSRKQQA